MYVKRPGSQDLPEINSLLLQTKKMRPITKDHLGKDSIALAAYDEDHLIGFIWVGLMANGTVAYIDKFVVAPEYRERQVGELLASELLKDAIRAGVIDCFAIVKQDEYHNSCAMVCLGHAMSGKRENYTYVEGNLAFMNSEVA